MKSISPNLVPSTSRVSLIVILFASFSFTSFNLSAQTAYPQNRGEKQLFMDIHRLEPGKLTYEEVAKAHAVELAV